MQNMNILIVGGTGSWAEGLINELIHLGAKSIKILARNEYRMIQMMNQFKNTCVEGILGDIRDKEALNKAMKNCQIVFNLAALKHVPICETMPFEAIETNILGTENVIQCAIQNKVEKVIYASTDKVVNANCTYGCTKLLGEKLTLAANDAQKETKFIVFRGGNLLGSRGSVIPLFKRQIRETGGVSITDSRMIRYFITIERASKLLVEVALKGAGGEIFIPNMPVLSIQNIAHYMLKKNDLEINNVKEIGIRPGEKMVEQLVSENERDNLFQLNEDLYLIHKNDSHAWVANNFIRKANAYGYNAVKGVLTYEETAKFLDTAGI